MLNYRCDHITGETGAVIISRNEFISLFVTNNIDQVTLLESRDRLGGRIHTDYSFGFPVDLGASW